MSGYSFNLNWKVNVFCIIFRLNCFSFDCSWLRAFQDQIIYLLLGVYAKYQRRSFSKNLDFQLRIQEMFFLASLVKRVCGSVQHFWGKRSAAWWVRLIFNNDCFWFALSKYSMFLTVLLVKSSFSYTSGRAASIEWFLDYPMPKIFAKSEKKVTGFFPAF